MNDATFVSIDGLEYGPLRPVDAEAAARLEWESYPTIDRENLFQPADIELHIELFGDGILGVRDADRLVAFAAGIFRDFDFDRPDHTIDEILGDHGCANHDPDGDWYYGSSITVAPSHRRRGIAGHLYDLRKDLVRRYGKRGIVAGGVLPGLAAHLDTMTAEEYVDRVRSGDLVDPTLTAQLANGFEVRHVLHGYLEDDSNSGAATLLVWER